VAPPTPRSMPPGSHPDNTECLHIPPVYKLTLARLSHPGNPTRNFYGAWNHLPPESGVFGEEWEHPGRADSGLGPLPRDPDLRVPACWSALTGDGYRLPPDLELPPDTERPAPLTVVSPGSTRAGRSTEPWPTRSDARTGVRESHRSRECSPRCCCSRASPCPASYSTRRRSSGRVRFGWVVRCQP
jgi:hypothetical protein